MLQDMAASTLGFSHPYSEFSWCCTK